MTKEYSNSPEDEPFFTLYRRPMMQNSICYNKNNAIQTARNQIST